MAVCCPWRYGITLILAVALLAIAVAAPRVSAAPGRALSAAQLSRRILSQSAATTQPLPDEQLPQGFATAKLPSEKVSISLLVKGTTEEQFKSGSLEKRLLSVTSNVTGIPADEWATTVANGPAPAVKPKPKEAPKVNRTVPANTTKHAATPAAAPKPATKARGTEESAIAPIPKPAEKEVKPSTAIPESSSKPQAKKTPVPAAAVPAPAAAASTKDVIIAGAQCGGRGGECSSKPDYKCADAAFAGYSCAAGYVCKRENEWYWHCDTDSSSAAAKSADPFTVGAYEQCGGQGGVCSGKSCADAVFPGYKCTLGYTCARQNEWYWQCVEEAGATASGGGRKLLQQVQRVSRSLQQQQQQQQQAAPGDLEVNLSILTDNPQLVIYRLSKAATAADASGCTTQYCSELAAAGVPIDSRSVQVTPTLAAVTAQVAQASSTSSNPRLAAAASPAEPSLQVQQPQQQSGTSNGKLIGGIIGGVVGGILLLVLLVLGGRRLMSRRHKVPAAEKESKDVYLDQAPVSPVVTQSRDFHSEGPTEAVAEVVKDPAMLQIRTSFSDFDTVKAAATTDQDPTPGPKFLAAAAAADAAAAGSSAAAAADGDAAQPRSARNSFNFVPKIARSFSFTNMLPGRKSTAAAADADVLVEPQTPEVEGTRADRSESAEHSPLAFPAAPEDDEHHDDFDPHHSARNSFHSRRNSFANRRSFGDSLYRSGSRNSGEYNAYRRGMNSYTSWASGAVPTAADLAAAVQKNVNSRRSFQKQRGPKATASTTPPGASTSKARRALHHSHSASDLTTRYTSSSAAAAGAASPAAAAAATPAAAPAGAEDMPLSSFPISNVASGTTTPTSSAAFLGGVGLSPVGMGSHAISGLTSGCATPSSVASGAVSVLGRPGDVVISRSDAILTSHALAGLRSTGNTPAPSVAGSLARGSTGSQGFPLNSYALPGLASGYNTPGGSVAGPLSRVSYNSVAGIGPRGYPISALPSGCVTPSSFYAGAVGSMTAGSHSHTLAPSVVAHALAGLESGYNTPAVSVAGSLARMSAGSEAYGGYHLNSHAIAGLASGAVTPSDRASVYSSAWVGMPTAAALAATDDNIVGGVPIDSHALSGLASGATTPGAAINAAAEAAAAGSGEGVLLFNAHALSNVHSGVSTPTSRRSLSTLSVHSDAEYALYRRGLSSYNMWLNESNNEAEAESAAAAATTAAATTAATTATATPTENAAGENAAANSAGQQITSGPTGYALSIASGYSSPKSAAPVALGRAGPMFTSHALSDMGSGTMTPYSMSTYSAYANQAYDGAALREHRQMVDPAQLNQALSRYYSSVEGVVVSQPVSRRNSTSSVVPEMPRLAE